MTPNVKNEEDDREPVLVQSVPIEQNLYSSNTIQVHYQFIVKTTRTEPSKHNQEWQ